MWGADLASTPLADALTSKGFDPSQRTLFTCEGIFCYLPQVLPTLPHAHLIQCSRTVSDQDSHSCAQCGADLQLEPPSLHVMTPAENVGDLC